MLGGKIRKKGHDFEDVVKAYEVWTNPTKNVPQLVGEIKAMTAVNIHHDGMIFSPKTEDRISMLTVAPRCLRREIKQDVGAYED